VTFLVAVRELDQKDGYVSSLTPYFVIRSKIVVALVKM